MIAHIYYLDNLAHIYYLDQPFMFCIYNYYQVIYMRSFSVHTIISVMYFLFKR